MKKVIRQVAVLAAALVLVCLVCRLTLRNTYVDHITLEHPQQDVARVEFSEDGEWWSALPNPEALAQRDEQVRMDIRPSHSGEAWYRLRGAAGEELSVQHYRVGRFLTVYDYDTGGFTGDSAVMVALTLFWLGVSLIMLRAFRGAGGAAFYAYDTIYYAGFFLFSAVTGLTMLNLTLRHFVQPETFLMLDAYAALSGAGAQFMVATLPLLLAFAVAMAVSNLALLRHERAVLKNLLGLLVALLLVAGETLGVLTLLRNYGSTKDWFWVQIALSNVYSAAFAYFECMLAGAVVCGTLAARRTPDPDRDFIIILGCWFRRDGTLPPLLKGRVDRALEFRSRQLAATGKEAVLVPSGGQGRDECMPEAEAMRRYLLEQGVPDSAILVENRSANTYQNMQFSKALIESVRPQSKVAFCTTNYHVFRSGVWAGLAGLEAEGMGSRTKWWYWPNAFMRECAGLLKNRWRQELFALIAMMGFFGGLTLLLR